ncbi:helix-turn-helix transcriptional regulator [Alkalihalobacillus trypoxylicola]|uniref:Cro/Cl family transcriptional regulator n=1 Tax=Alkalihalobacillus trypoxylicola TaxID=519424 RepID=A0A162F752_9BACI|nr:helix-turn-helix transcriptional regulator [Alkalihalobacillus trypoxylicola]KYG34948.1 Cro/Cl family transcriptional regulator [Alkalihalobacillus trypoxylicola]
MLNHKMKIARMEKGYTQQQLAQKIGITRQTISLIEKGAYNPSLKLCMEICYELEKTLDQLFWIDKEGD